MFFQNILKLQAHDQSTQARKKLFCCMIVNNCLCNVLSFSSTLKACMWRCRINEQTPLYCCRTARSSHWRCSIKKLTPTQVLPVDVAKVFRLAILKNICEWLLLDCFNGLLFRLKGSTFILCDSVKLQGLSHRSSFLFISWHFWS